MLVLLGFLLQLSVIPSEISLSLYFLSLARLAVAAYIICSVALTISDVG